MFTDCWAYNIQRCNIAKIKPQRMCVETNMYQSEDMADGNLSQEKQRKRKKSGTKGD